MRHQDQLKFGTTTTLDEPVSETIMRDLNQVYQYSNDLYIYNISNKILVVLFGYYLISMTVFKFMVYFMGFNKII